MIPPRFWVGHSAPNHLSINDNYIIWNLVRKMDVQKPYEASYLGSCGFDAVTVIAVLVGVSDDSE